MLIRLLRKCVVALVIGLPIWLSHPSQASVDPTIASENARPGAPASEWDVSGAGDPGIQGFATRISVLAGQTVDFKVTTASPAFRIDIYRLGYYAGLGARHVATVPSASTIAQAQPDCLSDAATGLVDCGNWSVSASWVVPVDAVSGVYLARLVREDTLGASHAVFIVRDTTRNADILFVTADTTWQAYNQYGGNSLYTGSPAGRAYKVSYNRPFTTRQYAPEDWIFNAEYPMIRWLEANGYDVAYASGVDAHADGSALLGHRVLLSVGHDEYWSGPQRAHVEAARDAGVNLAFFAGNDVFWKTRFEPGIDAEAAPHRTLVCYKETHAGSKIDPSPEWTGTWRDPRFSPPSDAGRPENALTGTIFTVNCCTYPMTVGAEFGALRFWRHTTVASLAPATSATLPGGVLGYEWNEAPGDASAPPGLVRLSSTTVGVPQRILDYGSNYGPGVATHNLTLYRAPSGALVFSAGTVQWSWGLDSTHDRGNDPPDLRMQQATVNLLADMGVHAGTLAGDLIPATESTDTAPPTIVVTFPADGATIPVGATTVITGTATDADGVVGAVEVSVDDGLTWRPAEGRASWSFAFAPMAAGTARIRARAADDSANLSPPTDPIAVSVEGEPCLTTLYDASVVPANANANDGTPIEVGVKFRSSVAGVVKGVRFYKGSQNTGAHVGRLYSRAGVLLASKAFSNPTPSGWQQVLFDVPVAIEADTTYVVSYFSPAGWYAFQGNAFASPIVRPPLRGLANNEDGPNGVYKYGGGFPTDSYQASSYFVDIVFDADCSGPEPGGSFSLFDLTPEVGPDPLTDNASVELGVKFQSAQDGFITALRFYKHPLNTGPHVGSLWTTDGTLLARETFAAGAASGWQEVTLSSPVPVGAGTLLVASYFTPSGHYAFSPGFFATTHSSPPLAAPASGLVGGNGVFRYGSAPGFPSSTFNASNYWVDVRFETQTGPDTTPPRVVARNPLAGASGVPVATVISADFNEALDPATVSAATFELRDDQDALIPGVVSYAAPARRVVFTPTGSLSYLGTYTGRVRGGSGGVTDAAGNPLAADDVWSFTTAPAPPDEGPGGPILVLASGSNPVSRYYAEILRAEGLNTFLVRDIATVTAAALADHAVAILGDFATTPAQESMLVDWVTQQGGTLIIMRPRGPLLSVAGLAAAGTVHANGYLAFDRSQTPARGLTGETIQYHSSADRWSVVDALSLASLYLDADTPAGAPAVTLRHVGAGAVVSFAFDLARSVVYTRQGNPDWAGQERDGISPLRSSDLFYGAAAGDPQTDWVNLGKVAIPQADEQQRLLANIIIEATRDRLPVPRLWYLPRDLNAAVVMTGDDHANNGTVPRFQQQIALSEPGCSVDDWECIRSTSYIYLNTPIADAAAAAFDQLGFEIALHPLPGCNVWTPASVTADLSNELTQFRALFPSLPSPTTNRNHCIAWADWATMPKVSLANGIRLDTNYYYWPPAWVQDRPGVFTGSAIPMRFADLDGTMIDVYQVTTQMTDESAQSYPLHADALLDGALGPDQFIGFFCANMHTDSPFSAGSDAIIASARSRGVPVVTARQVLAWIDGRGGTVFEDLERSGRTVSFVLAPAAGARNLRVMLPLYAIGGTLRGVTRDAEPVAFTRRIFKGQRYAVFSGLPGAFTATYDDRPECGADFNQDGFVDDADFVLFADAYNLFTTPAADSFCDLNLDTVVDDADFVLFAGAYNELFCP